MFFSTDMCVATIMVLALTLSLQGTIDAGRLFPNSGWDGCPPGTSRKCTGPPAHCQCLPNLGPVDRQDMMVVPKKNSLVLPQLSCPEHQVWVCEGGEMLLRVLAIRGSSIHPCIARKPLCTRKCAV